MNAKLIYTIIFPAAFAGSVCGQDTINFSKSKEAVYIHTVSGPSIVADSIWKIKDNVLEYEKNYSLHDVPTENILRIQKGNHHYIIEADTLYPLSYKKPVRGWQPLDTAWKYDPALNYEAMGAAHADLYVTPEGGFFAGMLLAPTVILPLAIALKPPRGADHLVDKTIYHSVPEYRKGYNRQGSKIKRKGVLFGVSAFAVLSGLIYLGLNTGAAD